MEISNKQRMLICTCGTYETAVQLSKIMVTEKLASKCSILPHLSSFYSWDNNIQEKHEYFILIFTIEELLEAIENRISEFGFDNDNQIIAFKISDISSFFNEWSESILK